MALLLFRMPRCKLACKNVCSRSSKLAAIQITGQCLCAHPAFGSIIVMLPMFSRSTTPLSDSESRTGYFYHHYYHCLIVFGLIGHSTDRMKEIRALYPLAICCRMWYVEVRSLLLLTDAHLGTRIMMVQVAGRRYNYCTTITGLLKFWNLGSIKNF